MKRTIYRQPARSLWRLTLVAVVGLAAIVAFARHKAAANTDTFPVPTRAALAGMSLRQRIVAFAESQVGYSTKPADSYCNKFSAHWRAGASNCPAGELDEEWCADFAAWAWQQGGAPVVYGYSPGEIDGAAVSFYDWGLANGRWHPAGSRYVAQPGDVAVYGLTTGPPAPTAAHVAIVTQGPSGQRGPDVVNGDGDQTGFSVVEAASDQWRVKSAGEVSLLAGYVSPP